MSAELITELADVAEALIEEGRIWSLRVDPTEPALFAEVHAGVRDELRDRGHSVRTSIEIIEAGQVDNDGMPYVPGEYLSIGPDWD